MTPVKSGMPTFQISPHRMIPTRPIAMLRMGPSKLNPLPDFVGAGLYAAGALGVGGRMTGAIIGDGVAGAAAGDAPVSAAAGFKSAEAADLFADGPAVFAEEDGPEEDPLEEAIPEDGMPGIDPRGDF